MSPILVVFFIVAIGSIGAFVFRSLNSNYVKNERYSADIDQSRNSIKNVLAPGEELILVDSGRRTNDAFAMSNAGIYYLKKGELVFHAAYNDIQKLKFMNYTGDKVSSIENVEHIKIVSHPGSCTLYSFPKAKEIASILEQKCF